MTELAALNVKLTGDAVNLRAALQSAEDGLENVATQARTTNAQVATTTTGFSRFGGALNRNSFAITNAANQFSDLAVQIQAGTPAARALSQQLPQLTAFMGPLASIIGVASGVLIGMGGAFLSARQEASNFQERLDSLDSVMDRVNAATAVLEMSAFELAEQYGVLADRVRELAKEELQLAEGRAAAALSEQVDILGNLARRYDDVLRSGGGTARFVSTAMRALNEDIGLTGDSARAFAQALVDATNAESTEEQIAAFNRMRDVLEQNNIEIAKLPDELQEALSKANSLEMAAINLGAALSNAAEKGADLSASLPATLVPGDTSALFNGDGSVGLAPSGAGAGVVSGGGGGGGAADPFAAEFAALQESLMTEEELQLASYQRQQEMLEQALAQKLITLQEYNDLMQTSQAQHQDAMAAIDVYRYGTGLQQTEAFLGDMASALSKGNDEMLKASQIFGAAQALINAWVAFSQALADPTIPTLGKIAAAGGVLAAGMGAVSAINSVSSSGGGAASAGATSTAASATAAQAPTQTQAVNVQLTGGDMFSRDQVLGLLEAINEASEDGAIVRLV